MKIFNTYAGTSNLDALCASTKEMYAFLYTGEMPANVEDLPFDINDPTVVINNSVCGCRLDSTDLGGGVLRYDFVGLTKPCAGYSESVDYPGFYRVAPSTFNVTEEMKKSGVHLAQALCASDVKFRRVTTNGAGADVAAGWFEFGFSETIALDKIAILSTTDTRYVPSAFILEKLGEDGETWEDHETIQTSSLTSEQKTGIDLATPLSAQKIRIRWSNEPGSGAYVPGFEFFTQTQPIEENTVEDLGWFLLIPDTTYSYENYPNLGERLPALWGSAGGPNEEQDLAMSSDVSLPGDFLKALNLKIINTPVGDLK